MLSIFELLKTIELENEELVVDFNSVEEVLKRGKSFLLLRLLTTQYYNREALKNTMRWVMAEIEQHNDKLRVVCDGPWSFNKNLILVKEFDGLQ